MSTADAPSRERARIGDIESSAAPREPGTRMTFTRHNVGKVCTLVRSVANASDLPPWRVADLLIAVSEIVTNAICYGGGTGSITLWNRSDGLLVEIGDDGPGLTDLPATLTERCGGLWLARTLVKEFDLVSTPSGVTVRMFVPS